jgi:hypothetical protein
MGMACNTHGGDDKNYKILVGKLARKRRLEKPRRRCEKILRIILKKLRQSVWIGFI